MNTRNYPSDLADEQWAIVAPLLPPDPGGRPRTTAMRDVPDATSSIPRTGCRWHHLPGDLPPKSTAWRYFADWRRDGALARIHDAPARRPARQRSRTGNAPAPADATGGGEERGRDEHEDVYGRRRHIVLDSMGLLLAAPVIAADVDDGVAARELFARLGGRPMSEVRAMYADTEYHNDNLYEWGEANAAWELAIIRRPKGEEGWVQLPIRCRRLGVDRERSVASSEGFVKLAMIQLMLHRLESDGNHQPGSLQHW